MSRPISQLRYGNRIIQQKQDNDKLVKHYQSIRKARPTTSHFQQRQTIINNKKKQLNTQNRFTQIQRQNRMLFQKITTIMNKGTLSQTLRTSSLNNKIMNRTLNSVYRKKQLQNIQNENAKMLKRLKQKKSSYQANVFHRDWQKKKQVIKKMALYPFIINDNIGVKKDLLKSYFNSQNNTYINSNNPTLSTPTQHPTNRINSSQNNTLYNISPFASHNQIKRIRKIDGYTFLITIKFIQQQQKLYIIGDLKQEENIKIIQLDKNQAESFIYQECNGNIEKIFDLLKYDQQGGDLYLISNGVNQLNDIKQIQKIQNKRIKQQYNHNHNINTHNHVNHINHNINNINHNINNPNHNSNGYIFDENKKRVSSSYIPHRQLRLQNPSQKNNRNFNSSFNNVPSFNNQQQQDQQLQFNQIHNQRKSKILINQQLSNKNQQLSNKNKINFNPNIKKLQQIPIMSNQIKKKQWVQIQKKYIQQQEQVFAQQQNHQNQSQNNEQNNNKNQQNNEQNQQNNDQNNEQDQYNNVQNKQDDEQNEQVLLISKQKTQKQIQIINNIKQQQQQQHNKHNQEQYQQKQMIYYQQDQDMQQVIEQ